MPAEFDCAECGQHVVDVIANKPRHPALCMECIYMPGWFNIPELRAILDPGGLANLPAHEEPENAEK